MEKKFSLENLPELKRRYSIGNRSLVFYIMTIDLKENAAYIKIVKPISYHDGVELTSLLNHPFYEENED